MDDEQDDIFEDKAVKSAKQSNVERDKENSQKNKSQINSMNLFDDDDNDNFESFLSPKSKTTAQTSLPKSQSKVTNLFEDDDFDDEIFLQPSEPTTSAKASTSTSIPSTILSNPPKKDVFLCNLFDDEPPEDDFDILATKKSANLGPPMVSSEVPDKLKSVPSLLTSPVKKTNSPVDSTPKIPANLFSPELNIFDDDDDEDFEKLMTPSRKTNESKSERKSEISFEPENSNSKVDRINEKNETTIAQTTKKSKSFDPVRLFDDTPPSDDEQLFSNISTTKAETKRKSSDTSTHSTGEFYNDFLDTVISPEVTVENPTVDNTMQKESLINKKPTKTKSKSPEAKPMTFSKDAEVDEKIEGKRVDFLKKVDVFSNPQSEKKAEKTSDQKVRQPKKLNIEKMDINVAALLPGAKLSKSAEKRNSPSKESSSELSNEIPSAITEATISKQQVESQDNVDSSGRLTNVNRNRAKNLSRRPSTRAGRRHQYQKSLQNDESSDHTDNNEPSNKIKNGKNSPQHKNEENSKKNYNNRAATNEILPMNKPPITKSVIKEPKPLERTVIFDDASYDDKSLFGVKQMVEDSKQSTESESSGTTEPSKDKEEVVKEPISEFEKSLDLEQAEQIETMKEPEKLEKLEELEQLKEFEEPNELILEHGEESIISEASKVEENPFSFLDDDEGDVEYQGDDDFMNIETKRLPGPEDKEYGEQATITVKATPAYINELPPDLDSVDEMPTKTTSATALLSANALSLFGDNDDDDFDDAIFTSDKSSNQPEIPKEIPKEEEDWSPYPSSSYVPATPEKKSMSNDLALFDDHLDNDDLFGATEKTDKHISEEKKSEKSIESREPEPKITPKTSVPKASQSRNTPPISTMSKVSLFGDDEDDSDLFGGPPPLPEPMKSKKPAKKIFSDDSSDDDLFGSGKKGEKSSSKTTSIAGKTLKNTKMSDKLFSDSEDDDLFGSKAKPKGRIYSNLSHSEQIYITLKSKKMYFIQFQRLQIRRYQPLQHRKRLKVIHKRVKL